MRILLLLVGAVLVLTLGIYIGVKHAGRSSGAVSPSAAGSSSPGSVSPAPASPDQSTDISGYMEKLKNPLGAVIDPDLVGLWLDSTPDPQDGYTNEVFFDFRPDGTFTDHTQHLATGDSLELGSWDNDVETHQSTIKTSDNNYTASFSDGSSESAQYIVSADGKELFVKYGTDKYALFFHRLGDYIAGGGLHFDLDALQPQKHDVEITLAKVWINSIQEDGVPYAKVTVWEIHPDGNAVLRVQHVLPGQKPTVGRADNDVQTVKTVMDAFIGRFYLVDEDGSPESGTYDYGGTTMKMTWDSDPTNTDTYQLYGDFKDDGSIDILDK